jgi:ABC-2 type transport system ATP-binding protein
VRQVAQERGAGVILCSHLLTEVESVCDDVVILSSGEVVARGPVGDVVGRTERNVVRVRVPEPSLAESQRALAALPNIKDVATTNGGATGWLRIRLDELAVGSEAGNGILEALIRAGIPVLSFEPEGGRLQDVFLQLTGRGAR